MNTFSQNGSKIMSTHLKRKAFVYIRQSTLRQVMENTESSRRQYSMREEALRLGWQSDQIEIIDSDQAKSGKSQADRKGFQRLVSEVSMGNAGIVIGLEVSRLARNNADWHRLLELCGFSGTLILDQDGLYNPSSFNDRLLLGLKGAMSEAELHILKSRMQQGLINKARRGELKTPLPAGFEYNEQDKVILTNDMQVRKVLKHFFKSFKRIGSAMAVTKEFRKEGIKFPHYKRTGPKSTNVIWSDLTHSNALRILHNVRYAGAFSFGKVRRRQDYNGRLRYEKLPQKEWIALVKDVHDSYISWEDFEANEKLLKSNATGYGGGSYKIPPREGPALLQGIVVCGKCGNKMTVRYHKRVNGIVPDYICQRDRIEFATDRTCQHIPGAEIDKTISSLLVELFNSSNINIALAIRQELEGRLDEVNRIHQREVDKFKYEVGLARRRYMQVDPEKRYVAEVLEADWNEKIRLLEEAQMKYDKKKEDNAQLLTIQQKDAVKKLSKDFTKIWSNGKLSDRERKRIIRLIIEDVTLLRDEQIILHIRFKGGASQTIQLPLPQLVGDSRRTSPEVVSLIDQLLEEHPKIAIPAILNKKGLLSGTGKIFTHGMVQAICYQYKLKYRIQRLKSRGLISLAEFCNLTKFTKKQVLICRKNAWIKAHHCASKQYFYERIDAKMICELKKKVKKIKKCSRKPKGVQCEA